MPEKSLRRFFISIVLPSILAIGFFILSIFIIILPSFERNIMEVKKEMISELTNTAWSLLDEYHREAVTGNMQEDSAKHLAADRVREIRYGDDYKDYFWIIDMQPVMIMHPYRTELIGKDLSDYEDPEGKLLFVEAVRISEGEGEGYIDYMWQWKDDSTRIVPKLSFVKAYEPWGWVVGTGIYLEDVREEIRTLRSRILWMSLLITLIISIILSFIIRQSLGIENKRKQAEANLQKSRLKYKSLVESSTEGTLMFQKGEIIFSNIKVSDISGYDPFEIRKLSFGELFETSWDELVGTFTDPKKSVSFETRLKCQDGSAKEVVVTASRIPYADDTGYVIILKEISARRKFEKENEFLSRELQTSLLLMDQPIRSLIGEIKTCPPQTPVREAASIMTRKQKNVLFISQEENIIGVISDRDLMKRVLAENASPERPVVEFMTSPVLYISEDAPMYEALLKMKSHQVSHLVTLGADDRVSGVIGYKDLSEFQHNAISFMIREIEIAENMAGIKATYKRLPVLISALIESGSRTISLTNIITSVNDAVHGRIIQLAVEDLGAPPCRFSFMVFGSEGRREQTLATDQDNGIVFEHADNQKEEDMKAYFLSLGERVNRDLHDAGYHYCRGDVMARNPKWTQSLAQWKEQFNGWINTSDPHAIMEANIFFDFRSVYGDEALIRELRDHISDTSENKAVFFYHMAQSVLKFKPPLNIFGHIVGNDSEADELLLDSKKILFPVISFLRLYSIREKIDATNSMERAGLLLSGKIIDHETYEEIIQAWSFLTMLRLRSQVDSITRNEPPGNMANIKKLSRIEQGTLKKIFSGVSELQTRVGFNFKGSEA